MRRVRTRRPLCWFLFLRAGPGHAPPTHAPVPALALRLQESVPMPNNSPSNNSPSFSVLELLESQHTEVDELIKQLEKGTGDRAALFGELADKVAAHSTVEEKLFYPAVMQSKTSALLHEAVEEHLAVKRVLADMLELDPDADEDEFEEQLASLKEKFSHHSHEEEEGKLFPILRSSMTEDELAGLGNEVLVMFEALMQEEPRHNVPEETYEPAPLPG
jgi:hemerythrin superfamily protein